MSTIRIWLKASLFMSIALMGGCKDSGSESQFSEDIRLQTVESVAAEIMAAGATVTIGEVLCCPETFLGIPTQVISVNGENVLVTIYESEAAAETVSQSISPDGFFIEQADAITRFTWVSTPHFYLNKNAIVLYVGENLETTNLLEMTVGLQFAGG